MNPRQSISIFSFGFAASLAFVVRSLQCFSPLLIPIWATIHNCAALPIWMILARYDDRLKFVSTFNRAGSGYFGFDCPTLKFLAANFTGQYSLRSLSWTFRAFEKITCARFGAKIMILSRLALCSKSYATPRASKLPSCGALLVHYRYCQLAPTTHATKSAILTNLYLKRLATPFTSTLFAVALGCSAASSAVGSLIVNRLAAIWTGLTLAIGVKLSTARGAESSIGWIWSGIHLADFAEFHFLPLKNGDPRRRRLCCLGKTQLALEGHINKKSARFGLACLDPNIIARMFHFCNYLIGPPQTLHRYGLGHSENILSGSQMSRNSPPVKMVSRQPQPSPSICLLPIRCCLQFGQNPPFCCVAIGRV